MTEQKSIEPQVEFAMDFEKHGLLKKENHLYFIRGAIGPSSDSACANVSRVDQKTGKWGEIEFVAIETGGLTELFRKIELILSERHAGCSKRISFDFERKPTWQPIS